MISFVEEEVDAKLKERLLVKKWIKQVALSYGYKVGELCYIFCNDDKILETNRQYLQHDYYTDIITFDYVENGILSGDMFISVDTVQSNSVLFNTSYYDELHRVIIHGVLHLCGLKDKQPADEAQMRKAEEVALKMFSELKSEQSK